VSAAAATAAVAAPRAAARRRALWRRRRTVAMFLAPWAIGFGVFFGYPLLATVYYSFTHYDLLSSPRWIGLRNYEYLFNTDPELWTAVKNTLWLIAVMVPAQVLFALGVAILISRARRGVGVMRTIFYLPALAPIVASTLGFVYLFNPANGPVNTILSVIGIEGPLWLNGTSTAKPTLVLLAMWSVGNLLIIFLAAVLDVPATLLESAQLDGAGALRRFVHVTLPTISPVLLFAVVIGIIDALQYFTQAYVAASVAQGGQAGESLSSLGYPQGSTLFYPIYLYEQAFSRFNMGYASAMSIVMLAVALALTLLILRNSRRWVYYQGAER
jgi:multiple sugar transport system permease protein